MSVHNIGYNCGTQYSIEELIMFRLIFQTIITAQMLGTGEEDLYCAPYAIRQNVSSGRTMDMALSKYRS